MRPTTARHDAVRALMADWMPRTSHEVAAALGISMYDASRALSDLKRHEYSVVTIGYPNAVGGHGRGPALWQRNCDQGQRSAA